MGQRKSPSRARADGQICDLGVGQSLGRLPLSCLATIILPAIFPRIVGKDPVPLELVAE